jgi:hypothetical protein
MSDSTNETRERSVSARQAHPSPNTPPKRKLTEELVTGPTDRSRRRKGDHPRAHSTSKSLHPVPSDDDPESFRHSLSVPYPWVRRRSSGLQEGLCRGTRGSDETISRSVRTSPRTFLHHSLTLATSNGFVNAAATPPATPPAAI